jgi:protein-serine/threonine kinase
MTQFFNSSVHSTLPAKEEKRTFSGLSLTSNRPVSNNQVSQKIRNFFRINNEKDSKTSPTSEGRRTNSQQQKADKERSFRQSRFFIGRIRSTTVNSEGNALEEVTVSPTAHANPYFHYQGPPGIRHHNEGSVPPSPPDSPSLSKDKHDKAGGDTATNAGKEELARKLRRVASAPNAHGLFSTGNADERPSTAELGKQPILHNSGTLALTMLDTTEDIMVPIPNTTNGIPSPGQIRNAVAFRRTYSSNSIKVRSVEVGPSSFDKIKLIGKGDVGKVYLVREKKSGRLYAMKGKFSPYRHC